MPSQGVLKQVFTGRMPFLSSIQQC